MRIETSAALRLSCRSARVRTQTSTVGCAGSGQSSVLPPPTPWRTSTLIFQLCGPLRSQQHELPACWVSTPAVHGRGGTRRQVRCLLTRTFALVDGCNAATRLDYVHGQAFAAGRSQLAGRLSSQAAVGGAVNRRPAGCTRKWFKTVTNSSNEVLSLLRPSAVGEGVHHKS